MKVGWTLHCCCNQFCEGGGKVFLGVIHDEETATEFSGMEEGSESRKRRRCELVVTDCV